jgi:hypothetical protein
MSFRGLFTGHVCAKEYGIMLRFFASSLCLLLILILSSSGEKGLDPLRNHSIEIAAQPISLNTVDPRITRLGALEYLGGWVLTSDDAAFGGLSALYLEKGVFHAIGDAGTRVDFSFDGRVISAARIRPLPVGCGHRWLKRDQDSESLAINPITHDVVIGLEMRQSLCVMQGGFRDQATELRPDAMRLWPRTGGPESATFLPDGRLLVLAERDDDAGKAVTPALLFPSHAPIGVGTPLVMGYEAPAGFRAVDAVALKDGRLLVLNRRFAAPFSFTASLVMIERPDYRTGMILKGQEIARFASPYVTDNLEGLAIEQKSEETIIWLTSDDNFMPLQQTLLLRFRLRNQSR